MKTFEPMRGWLRDVSYRGYRFFIYDNGEDSAYLQGEFTDEDIVTREPTLQKTRKWKLSLHMTKSEFIQTVFKCVVTSAEHQCREHFRYKGSAVYSPHYDVDELEKLCKARKFDYREP